MTTGSSKFMTMIPGTVTTSTTSPTTTVPTSTTIPTGSTPPIVASPTTPVVTPTVPGPVTPPPSPTVSSALLNQSLTFLNNYIDFEYMIRRFSQRNGQLTGPFNPNVIAGFPMEIEERFSSNKIQLLYAYVVSVTHNIDKDSSTATTSLQLSMVRSADSVLGFPDPDIRNTNTGIDVIPEIINAARTENVDDGLYKKLGLNDLNEYSGKVKLRSMANLREIKHLFFGPQTGKKIYDNYFNAGDTSPFKRGINEAEFAEKSILERVKSMEALEKELKENDSFVLTDKI